MKVFIIGDPHFKYSNITDMDKMTEKIIMEAKRIQPDFIVIMGDVLDRHASLHMTPLNRAIKFFENLQEIAILYILIGNHDRKNNQEFLSDEHPFTAVEKWGKRVKIASKPFSDEINGEIFTFVPHVPPGRFMEALEYVKGWQNSKCIFAHQEFYGCNNGALFSLIGDKWDENLPLCISGHIHDFCILQKNIIYVGTPHQNNFGEKLDKTVSLFTFKENNSFIHERIDLKLPKKIMHNITFEQIKDYNLTFNDEHKIIIHGNPGELKEVSKHPNFIKWKKSGAMIILKPIILTNNLESNPNKLGHTKKNFFSTLKQRIEKEDKVFNIFLEYFGSFDDLKNKNIN